MIISFQRCRLVGKLNEEKTTLAFSMVGFVKATDTFGSLLGKISEELSSETVEKVTISSSSKADSHIVPLGAPVVAVSFITFVYPCVYWGTTSKKKDLSVCFV